jgi:hypothetical protein
VIEQAETFCEGWKRLVAAIGLQDLLLIQNGLAGLVILAGLVGPILLH